jgi:hypothetical protein
MFTESRKIQLAQNVLKETNETLLLEMENVLKNAKNKTGSKKKKISIYDFVGMLTEKEADDMTKAITESCEKIDTDEWK